MLRELLITNFALIEQVRLEFGPGLNLLTGETGAGKSILIDALGLALGERAAGIEQIRSGSERATIEALFDLADAPDTTLAKIAEYGAEPDDDDHCLIVVREISIGGKSVCRANGRLIPLSALREIMTDLIDVHGQHEHQSLLAPDKHLLLFDNWLGERALVLRSQAAAASVDLGRLKREHEQLHDDARERARNLDLYEYQLQEMDDAALREDEEGELISERVRLSNAEKLCATAEEAYRALDDVAIDALNSALSVVERAQSIDPAIGPVSSSLTEAVSFADDARRALRRYRDRVESNPERLEEIENRLSQLQSLKRKYGDSVSDIMNYADKLRNNIAELRNSEAMEHDVELKIERATADLDSVCGRLSSIRRKEADNFATQITEQLIDLGMAAAAFQVKRESTPPGPRGVDDIEFMVTTNSGEQLRPLAKVASGGELSRVMLALKSVLAKAAYKPTLIFDEIDVGVGGRTAAVIANKLHALAKSAQVLVITHLPQIASMSATAHFAIEKRDAAGRTVVSVQRLTDEARIEEIVRMLGGDSSSDTVVKHARELLAAR